MNNLVPKHEVIVSAINDMNHYIHSNKLSYRVPTMEILVERLPRHIAELSNLVKKQAEYGNYKKVVQEVKLSINYIAVLCYQHAISLEEVVYQDSDNPNSSPEDSPFFLLSANYEIALHYQLENYDVEKIKGKVVNMFGALENILSIYKIGFLSCFVGFNQTLVECFVNDVLGDNK